MLPSYLKEGMSQRLIIHTMQSLESMTRRAGPTKHFLVYVSHW